MAAKSSPTTRLLALAALLLAAGLFSVRAIDVFAAPATIESSQQSPDSLTSLLQTLHGPQSVRLIERASPETGSTFLVLMNASEIPSDAQDKVRTDIQSVLTASAAFAPQRDQISFIYAPFETQARTPSALEIGELVGLGALVLLTLMAALAPVMRQDDARLSAPMSQTPIRPVSGVDLAPDRPSIAEASARANNDPDHTVHVLRKWMSEDAGGVS